MKFRYDINGLRAVSVLAVIFFHSGISSFSGGFLGVDVFFVISGFLITANVIREFENNTFSILSFYDRRMRRIIPALLFVMLVVLVLSFFLMLPYDLKNMGQSLVSSSFGLNNILLYMTSGYWSSAAEFKPLYHTWSLGVEEQYYFIIPLIFIALYRWGSHKLVILGFVVTSWLISYFTEDREFDFLMLPNRFWELGIGSLIALYYPTFKLKSDKIAFLGFVLIVFSCIFPYWLSDKQSFYALVPVFGTALVIIFAKTEGMFSSFFQKKYIVLLGLSSYSIYLLHQPLLAFYRLTQEQETQATSELMIALMSVPLGLLTWRYIENTARNRQLLSNKKFYASIVSLITILSCSGLFLHKTYGLQGYDFNKNYEYGPNPQAYVDRIYSYQSESFVTRKDKVLIIGNSFARDFANILFEGDFLKDKEVIYLFDYYSSSDKSHALLQKADYVFYVSSDNLGHEEIKPKAIYESTEYLKNELDRYVTGQYFFVGTKNFGFNNNFIKVRDWDDTADYSVSVNERTRVVNDIQSNVMGDRYIDIQSLTGNGDKTRIFTDDHKFISFDTNHLTVFGARYIAERLRSNSVVKNLFE